MECEFNYGWNTTCANDAVSYLLIKVSSGKILISVKGFCKKHHTKFTTSVFKAKTTFTDITYEQYLKYSVMK